ncbi:glycosyltransferase family 4 protein [Cohnella sp. WQ 127256]|uniref:glycosyltransferase family 4 protein n=1 Tax=Cohnella sp. WQ 127256 TaxID=2938790 RepID=UPI002119499A|nr:glycosyltransferase family 4 protein [Cohnella sp. WQ 127256]
MKSRKKLKVWVLTNEFHPIINGGLGIVATQLTKALSNSGVEVIVVCASDSDKITYSKSGDRPRIVRLPKDSRHYNHSARAFKSSNVLRAAATLSSGKPDLIHVHSTDFSAVALAAGSLYKVPIVYTCHSMVSKGITSVSGKNQAKLIRASRRIVVPSKWQAGEIKLLYPGKHRIISIIPHGVKSLSMQPKGSPDKLLYIGRLISSKGITPLIKAIALLSHKNKNVSLTIVGSGKARYENRLRTLSRQLGISKRIHWVKKSPNAAVQRMYASYGAVVVPSKKESFCLVALEAMANGVPLVSTLSGGLREFANTRNTQVISSVDSSSIANAITALWRSPTKTKLRVTNARITAARYKWPVIARRYKSLFKQLRKVKSI